MDRAQLASLLADAGTSEKLNQALDAILAAFEQEKAVQLRFHTAIAQKVQALEEKVAALERFKNSIGTV